MTSVTTFMKIFIKRFMAVTFGESQVHSVYLSLQQRVCELLYINVVGINLILLLCIDCPLFLSFRGFASFTKSFAAICPNADIDRKNLCDLV